LPSVGSGYWEATGWWMNNVEFVWVHSFGAFCLLLDLRFSLIWFSFWLRIWFSWVRYGWFIIMVVMAAFRSLMGTGMDDSDVDQVLGWGVVTECLSDIASSVEYLAMRTALI